MIYPIAVSVREGNTTALLAMIVSADTPIEAKSIALEKLHQSFDPAYLEIVVQVGVGDLITYRNTPTWFYPVSTDNPSQRPTQPLRSLKC